MIKFMIALEIFSIFAFQFLYAASLAEEFKKAGYIEICDQKHGTETFDALYACFEECIGFLQINPLWAQKLYMAKERFIRSKDRNYYSTDFFGFYDESKKEERRQISFYYSVHFHKFIRFHYPELYQIPEISHFFEACFEIQKSYAPLFRQAAVELELETIFPSREDLPILFKVVKYFPSYIARKPHYDGTAFSLFLDSTDNPSLLLSPYKHTLTVDDFSSPKREYPRSVLLIPGTLLTEFSIYPTPHIVVQNGKDRYATIAFAMRPNYIPQKMIFSHLPDF